MCQVFIRFISARPSKCSDLDFRDSSLEVDGSWPHPTSPRCLGARQNCKSPKAHATRISADKNPTPSHTGTKTGSVQLAVCKPRGRSFQKAQAPTSASPLTPGHLSLTIKPSRLCVVCTVSWGMEEAPRSSGLVV